MKKRVATVASALALTMLAVGCGTNSTGGTNTTAGGSNTTGNASTTGQGVKVGLVTDTGGLNDNGFNHLAYVGVTNAQKQLGAQASVVQSQSESDYIPNLSKYAAQGYDLVIAVGYLMHDAVEQVAKQYPKTHFMIIDDTITDRPNVVSAVYDSQDAGYLAGAMAGLLEKGNTLPNLNKQNVVGVIGGQSAPPVNNYIAGFQQGFKQEDPSGKVLLSYTNSFTDQSLGSQYAQNQLSQGADIIFPVAGGCGQGAISAVKAANKYAIGVDTNQSYLAPQNIITSATKGVDTSVFDVIQSVKNNTFKSGVQTFGLKGNGVGITPAMKGVPQSVVNEVNQLKQNIVSGKIQVSTTVQK
ncbi:BMP family lipoprotein [Alicyclobacillus fastidiosus]|uniref:BMP family ABC transporter substrate-binding protein n=1 Tax=Alicyclobacillus fastidiosus TaxID=392011 RepID=A0ABV5AJK0_9BACL|nr:BMP family ABC transporter substrate-binding protein [Alicyclobacillus fastidiosus]WEH08252.1 BMP family ABC transporter substrate-binding protein [Alicyclobacillus fastidiosus]